jgi:acyl-homoserine lactone synthase
MLITVSKDNRQQHDELMDELFRIRYEQFILRRGWSDLKRPDMRDIDAYDDIDTSYIIALDGARIVGGARVRPTTVPHMLDEVFGFLCKAGHAPAGDHIGECSRTFVDRRHPNKRSIFVEVLLGVAEHSVASGYTQLTGVLETWWAHSYLSVGLQPTPLGSPQNHQGLSLMGVCFDVNEVVLASLSALLQSMQTVPMFANEKARQMAAGGKNARVA